MAVSARRTYVEIGMCCDLATCGISLLFASSLLYRPLWNTEALLVRHPLRQVLITSALGLAWHLSLVASGAYRSYRITGLRAQVQALANGTTFAAVWAGVWLCLSRWNASLPARSLFVEILSFWVITFSGLVATRLAARLWTRALRRRGRNLRNILIIGSNRRAVALADRLLINNSFGFNITGFVDDEWHFKEAPENYKRLLLGSSENLLELLRSHPIDEVIIALPIASSYALTQQILNWCLQQGIPVRSEGNLFDIRPSGATSTLTSQPMITLHEVAHSEWDITCKRLLDLFVSGSALIVFLPLLAVIACAIRLTSSGPALFAQERLGLNKRRFAIYKFRTMVINAEALMAQVEHLNQSQGPTFKLQHDPRVTRIGSFLRKTSLDELPQLLNVFLGQMSLVGPRPLPLRDYQGFSEDWHRRRFSVKPGVTCLWQISGRSSVAFERWMELDMDYIDRWSLWLDLEILLKTIPAVIGGSGAM